MCRLFTFITCIVIAAGAVSDNVIVKVKRGENFSLCVRTEPKTVRRFTVQRNGTQEVFRFCSPEEQSHGCKPNNSERCSLQIGNENFSVTFLHANTSDEGVYDVEVIDDKNKRIHQKFTVALTGSLETEDIPIKVKETPWTFSLKQLNIFAGVFVAIVSLIYFSLLLIIYCICEKKQNNANAGDNAGDSESIPLQSSSSGASKAMDESLEIVDETLFTEHSNSQQEGRRKDLNHGDRKRMTDKTGRTRYCVVSQNNHKG